MKEDLRAAANRLAEIDLGMYQNPTDHDADMRAGVVLARAWLAEHPADSEEPVSEEWLQSIGGKHQEFGGMYSFFGDQDKRKSLLWMDVSKTGDTALSLVDEKDIKWLYLGEKTRGDVRHLFRALGIDLKG